MAHLIRPRSLKMDSAGRLLRPPENVYLFHVYF